MKNVKTTIEVPDSLFRRANEDKPWMKTFGKLRDLHAETIKINRIIEQEFGQLEPEDRDRHFDFISGLKQIDG